MHRKSADIVSRTELVAGSVARAAAHDPARIVAALEEHVLERRRERFQSVIAQRLDSVRVLFDAPYDPHNGAAVVRSADAFGVQHVHVVERQKPFLAAREVSKSANKWIDLHLHATCDEAVGALVSDGFELVGAHPDGELAPEDLATLPRVALVLGNERDGIADELMARCHRRVRVPMRGFVDSLNVSVTAAILLHAATRGRAGDLPEADRLRLYARGLYLTVARPEEILALKAAAGG